MTPFPAGAAARDRLIVALRPPLGRPAPSHAHGIFEEELGTDRSAHTVATIFLTGRECPWHCTMCDLWQHTTVTDTPRGALPSQISHVWSQRPAGCSIVKLYNAGSFFDHRAVPESDYPAIAATLIGASRVIVESHPSLVGARVTTFMTTLKRAADQGTTPALEVAMGLETCHPSALERLNKRMTTDDVLRAGVVLRERGIDVRIFLLVSPPFIPVAEQDVWLIRSIDCAIACGASAISLIPTRAGNGTMEALAASGDFVTPSLSDLERSLALSLAHVRGRGVRVFADLWDSPRFSSCAACVDARLERMRAINLSQNTAPPIPCQACGHERAS